MVLNVGEWDGGGCQDVMFFLVVYSNGLMVFLGLLFFFWEGKEETTLVFVCGF